MSVWNILRIILHVDHSALLGLDNNKNVTWSNSYKEVTLWSFIMLGF